MAQKLPKGSVQLASDVVNKGIPLRVPADLPPDIKVDLAKQEGQHLAFPLPGKKPGLKQHAAKLNLHPEEQTIKYRKGPDDNKKYTGKEDLFAGQ